MSDMGLQTFISGTSFDVLTTMGTEFIIHAGEYTAGTYTLDFSYLPAATLSADLMWIADGTMTATDTSGISYSQSGKTITFTLTANAVVSIKAEPSGLVVNDVYTFAASRDGKMLVSPDFTPMVLVDVVDIGQNDTYQTKVPSGNKFFAFHRGTSTASDQYIQDMVLWQQIVQNGFHTIKMQGRSRSGTRVYIFSDMLPPAPLYGFFVYKNGNMVYHSNCLPLRYKKLNKADQVAYSDTPLAVMNSATAVRALASGQQVIILAYASSAGYNASAQKWTAVLTGYQVSSQIAGGGTGTRDNTIPYISYIDCEYYDRYYRQSLGI